MALDFMSALEQMTNPTNDLGGGPGGADSAKAIAQLILGGGSMSAQGADGSMQPVFGGNAVPGAVKTSMSPSFQKVLEQAEQMAGAVRGDQLGKASIAGPGQGNSMTQNPYGDGAFDPTNPAAVAAAQANAKAIGVNYTTPQQRMAAGNPVGNDPTSEAFYSTATFAPKPQGTSTQQLVANPYGPGSFDPSDPAAVAEVKKRGTQDQKVGTARQLIQQFLGEQPVTDPRIIMQEIMGMATNGAEAEKLRAIAPQLAMQASSTRQNAYNERLKGASPIIRQILESVGIKDQEDTFGKAFAAARGTEMGKLAGGGGKVPKANIPSAVMRSIGTTNFHDEIDKGIADGSITPEQQIQLETRHQAKWQSATPSERVTLTLSSLETAANALDRVKKAYEDTPAFKTGKMSDTFKTALAMSVGGAAAQELLPFLTKLTPEERRYVAESNVFSLNLRNVSQDSRFSNFDSQKVLQAVGNPIMGRDLYMEQIGAAGKELFTRYDGAVEDLARSGKRMDEFRRGGRSSAGEDKSPAGSKAGDSGTRNGIKWKNVGGKIMIGE